MVMVQSGPANRGWRGGEDWGEMPRKSFERGMGVINTHAYDDKYKSAGLINAVAGSCAQRRKSITTVSNTFYRQDIF